MRQGIVAAFTEINAKGGVHGRKLQLISRDDGYDPDRSVAQTLQLIEEDKVFALIGAVGTPTAMATVPITSARNVPFIGPFTGAEFLRDLELANVVNIRASYGAEAEAWVKHLTEDLHFTRIAIFYQDDSFGRDGLAGVKRRWKGAAWSWPPKAPSSATPARSARPADDQARRARSGGHGRTYGPCAEFIKLAQRAASIRSSSTSPSSAPMRWPKSSAPKAKASSSRRSCRFRGTLARSWSPTTRRRRRRSTRG